jgi:ribonuclease HII
VSRRPAPGPRLFGHDRRLGFRYVAGADEAGRGCLAGPLIAAAVLFDQRRLRPADVRAMSALDDSKRQRPEVRAALYPEILQRATRVTIVSRSAAQIDSYGLHVINLDALFDALASVARDGCICLSDGFSLPPLGRPQRAILKGDATSAAIAAASVIAKETRDRYMRRVGARLPDWKFDEHVGYATPAHRAAIERFGVTPLHRLSFRSVAYREREPGDGPDHR